MKLIFIPLLLLLASCSQYRYDITYEKCNGQTGSFMYVWEFPIVWPSYSDITSTLNFKKYPYHITNVCDFSYTRNEIK